MEKFIGIYDVNSAKLMSEHVNSFFLSGLGFASSYYGLPDIGYVTWQDMLGFCQRVSSVLPNAKLLVDIDDGYGGPELAQHMVACLKKAGAYGFVLEDQLRPKKCGHLPGKRLQPLSQYIETVTAVLEAKGNLFFIARTDAASLDEQIKRVEALSKLPVDAILVDGINIDRFMQLRKYTDKKLCLNYLEGGNCQPLSSEQMIAAGVDLLIMSAPCLFATNNALKKVAKELVVESEIKVIAT